MTITPHRTTIVLKMKLLSIIIILLICFLYFFAACEEQPLPTETPQMPTPAPTPTEEQPPPTETPQTPTPTPTEAELQVHFIDVGQGDSILIDHGENEVLIDGGDKQPGVVPYLNKYVDGALEVIVATHPHDDHIGGLIAVLDAFQVKEIWHNGEQLSSNTCDEFMSGVEMENAEVHLGRRGDNINIGELTFTILNPINLEGTTNNNSIVMTLSYGTVDFLFTGDAEREAEAAMLMASDIPVPNVEILKVCYHGSRLASSKDFLAVTSPEVAIYMAGEGNRWGLPNEETIKALKEIGADIYGTDVHGNVVVTTDGEEYTLLFER